MQAYILISVAGNEENNFIKKLKELPEILESHVLFGEWDIVAKVELKNSEELGKFMIEKIRTIPNTRLTSTLIVAN